MTLEERLAIIENKAIRDKDAEMKRKADLQIKTENALQEIKELTPRIEALITVVNKCIEEKVKLPSSMVTEKYGYGNGYKSYNFSADGIHHHVGFMDCDKGWWNINEGVFNKIEYLGIDEGGFCGVWDFYTNGKDTFLRDENDGTIKEAELDYMKQFLEEFGVFEESFYKWIDSLSK